MNGGDETVTVVGGGPLSKSMINTQDVPAQDSMLNGQKPMLKLRHGGYPNNRDQFQDPRMDYVPLGSGYHGMNVLAANFTINGMSMTGAIAGFEGVDMNDDLHGITPGVRFSAMPTDQSDFTFSWVQVINTLKVTVVAPSQRNIPVQAPITKGMVLDNKYPYAPIRQANIAHTTIRVGCCLPLRQETPGN